jgi:hypothetical protein
MALAELSETVRTSIYCAHAPPGKRSFGEAAMRTPDGHGRLELSRFLTPPATREHL